MQKVEGSSPFSRSQENPAQAGFLMLRVGLGNPSYGRVSSLRTKLPPEYVRQPGVHGIGLDLGGNLRDTRGGAILEPEHGIGALAVANCVRTAKARSMEQGR
jgi:hypothetical protein